MPSIKRKTAGFTVIGLMSGTSLDGLDIACCEFTRKGKTWNFDIKAADTIQYSISLAEKLAKAHLMPAEEFWRTHVEFGQFCGTEVKKFIQAKRLKPMLVASHGHTVFHQPENGFTCQIGDGAQIAVHSGLLTICDFRSTDLALGGQGAPLVPIGDTQLFSEYDACLNIGGIANISFVKRNKVLAFDICPTNFLFNFYAARQGKKFDRDGEMARAGRVYKMVLNQMDKLDYYHTEGYKSIGREWIEQEVISLLERNGLSIEDKQATCVEHAAQQIAKVLNTHKIKRLLITGGGAYHSFLLERIKAYTKCRLILPDKKIIEYKEALIFAFLGLLRYENKVNCLSSVTGAKKDNSGGAVYLP
ncbi:MAG: anhydro-N-acetylmuramic acid kinase [Bacteroidetes bacterium]|jgi:anhydro-N-acetylmuramic acid kinase|nr:anhydro-N-acetylmuramic acid kinase [Bacteroidota bacterium]